MNLFKSKSGMISADEFSKSLESLELKGKNVIIYSRLLSLGRFSGKDAIIAFLNILKEHIGSSGTLVIPTYTLNSYKEPRVFDFDVSTIMSGILGEVASKDPSFARTVHPVYSNCIAGKFADTLMEQDATTCFGEGSLFDLFSKLENACVMMIGLNFNGPTLYHYYDQKYNAPGRFIKKFRIKMKLSGQSFNMRFNSYVKEADFYEGKINSLARFDALAETLEYVKRLTCGDDHIHLIKEKDFQSLYKAALAVDQKYFLLGTPEEWESYYMKNRFSVMHGTLEKVLVQKVREFLKTDSGF